MGYVYSDSEMMMATQIAYLNFDGNQDIPVGQIVNSIIQKYGKFDNNGNPVYGDDGNIVLNDAYANDANSKELTKQLQVVSNIKKLGDETSGLTGWENWKVVDVCNDQNDTGYYGMLIDTGDGNAIIGCRGSESYNGQQVVKDWIVADVGLLNSELTTQQERSQKYMEELWYKYGDKYDSFSVTGHSLGGNLAEHMTITAPIGMREKIDHTISFDGPGYSQEYLDAHKDEIAKVTEQMSHYQWSWVSSLLLPLPGVQDTIIAAHDEENKSILMAMLFRHDTHNVEFDENGNVMPGSESGLAAVLGPISKYIEHLDDMDWYEYIRLLPYPELLMFVRGAQFILNAAQKIYEVGTAINEKLKDLYYNYIATQVSGEIEIDLDKVSQYTQELNGKIKLLQNERDEIDSIRGNLRYWSAAGAYYRSRLMMIRNGLDIDIFHMQKMVKHLSKCVNSYASIDRKVASSFA